MQRSYRYDFIVFPRGLVSPQELRSRLPINGNPDIMDYVLKVHVVAKDFQKAVNKIVRVTTSLSRVSALIYEYDCISHVAVNTNTSLHLI